MAAIREEIQAHLRALGRSTARETRLEVAVGPIYVLVSTRGSERRVRCQVVSSSYLPGELKLGADGGMQLRALGYAKGSGQRNWIKEIGADETELARHADEIVDVLSRVYGCELSRARATLVHDETDHPENPELVDAMTAMAADHTQTNARHRLYNAMLNATFLVPLDPDADDAADAGEEFLVLERLDERPVFGVFTDWASLQLWNPRTWPYLPVHGSDLFQLVLDRSAALLDINPRGNTGGQLYAHELVTLAHAVRDWKRKNLH